MSNVPLLYFKTSVTKAALACPYFCFPSWTSPIVTSCMCYVPVVTFLLLQTYNYFILQINIINKCMMCIVISSTIF